MSACIIIWVETSFFFKLFAAQSRYFSLFFLVCTPFFTFSYGNILSAMMDQKSGFSFILLVIAF